MNTAMKKALALVLSLVMVLGTMGVYAYGGPISEPVCICSTKCAEGEINEDCPVCGEEDGDITACLGKEREKAECICSTKCAEGEINEDCPVCGGENGDISSCLGKEREKAECICSTKCAEGEINEDCPVCGGEDGDITSCLGVGAVVLSTPSTRGIVATKPSGDGTEAKPYQISSAAELYWFAGLVNGTLTDGTVQNKAAWAELTTDITVNTDVLDDDGNPNSGLEAWTPIGSYGDKGDEAYTGTFDGDRHTISGLYVNGGNQVGLFGYVGTGGKIQNVGVVDSYIHANSDVGGSYVGGVCGYNHGGIIENCYNTGDVSGSDYVGGVCGYNNGGIIEKNCYNTGDVSGDNSVGGVCGYNFFGGFITSCYNTGNVSGNNAAGGVCGWNSDGTIENCYNIGSVSGDENVGGVCGRNDDTCSIENCYNTGNVSGNVSGSYVGGVCGVNGGRIENCYNTGNVSGSDNSVGGVCGVNGGRIENCWNIGSVSGSDNSVGGVCGVNGGRIENCWNIGSVSGNTNYTGGVCGYNFLGGFITSCYNTGDVSGNVSGSYVGGVCGVNGDRIENCYNTGEVSGNTNYTGGVCGWNIGGTITNCYFLSGTANQGVGNGSSSAAKKEHPQFASGEVAWLLNGASKGAWIQDIGNKMPVLKDNLPEGVEKSNCKEPVRVTINKSDQTDDAYGYTTAGSALNISLYPYPTGYVFFEDEGYKNLIKNIGAKEYTSDTIIYAALSVTGISLNKTELSLYVGGEETLTAQVQPDNAYNKNLTWSSSDNTVATVDSGKVTALKAGTAIITATAADGQGAKTECTVTVRKKSSGGGSPFYYFVTFETNGGDTMSTIVKKVNTTIDLDEYVPTREGYKFVGWYADEDLTKPIDEITLTQSTTIYAKWEKIEEEEQEETTEQEETAVSFTDVRESDWFYKAVSYAVENSLMSGMGDGTFSPNTPLQREMFATVLWNLEGNPAPKDVAPFLDVTSDKYYADAIAWASENGIVAGFGDTFGVGVPITREQFAVMLHNYAQYKGYDVSVGEDTNILSYADAFDISNYAYPAMQWACGAGIINGMGDGTLVPQGQTTRAETATILMNFCENVVK